MNSKNKKIRSFKLFAGTSFAHIACMFIAFSMMVPFVWMLLASVSSENDFKTPDNWLPETVRWENYVQVFDDSPGRTFDGRITGYKKASSHNELTMECKDGRQHTFPLDNQITILTPEGQIVSPDAVQEGQDIRADLKPGKGIPFGRYYANSIFVSAWVTFLQVFTSALAAFAFSRIQWRGRDKVFLLYLSTMMLPGLIMMIPNYQIMTRLGLVDTYVGLILPGAFSAFGTFLLRQFMMGIPSSLDEAAEIDGASKWRVFWDVILPLCRPGLITLTIFTFMGTYRGLFWPLVMLKSEDKLTLPIGLMYFNSSYGSETQLIMAASAMMIIPLIILFVVLQRWLVKGIQLGAVKG